MYDETHFTHDAAVASFKEDANGIERTEDGDISIDWDEVEQVTVNNPPHADAFETKQFYRLPATVAKPIRQPYHYGEDNLVWLKKPREELKKAAWSLDNAPVTMSHPETTMVKDVDDVHGFWDDTRYVDGVDDLDSYAHIPVDDDEAKEYVEEHGDVSVGFYNKIARVDEYDGIVGGSDDSDEVDGYQTNMVFDHCAFVGTGRCSSEHGCGLDDAPAHGKGYVADEEGAFKWGTVTNNKVEEDMETVDQPEGIYTEDGDWYGISPSENPDGDSPKYPLNSCNDVKDAWNLRGHGSYSVEQSTLEARIKRVSESKDCSDEYRPWADEYEGETDVKPEAVDYCPCNDCENETETHMEFDFALDDLTAEAALDRLAEQHEGIEELTDELDELRGLAEAVDEALESIDVDSLEAVPEYVEGLEEKADGYDDIMQERLEEDAEKLAELTDKFEDAEEVLEQYDSREEVQDRIELLKDAVETSETTTDSGNEPETPEETIHSNRVVPDAWK